MLNSNDSKKFQSLVNSVRQVMSGQKQINEQVGEIPDIPQEPGPFERRWKYPDGSPTPPGQWYNPGEDQTEPSDLDPDQEWVDRMQQEIQNLQDLIAECQANPQCDAATLEKLLEMLEDAIRRLWKFLRDRGWSPSDPNA